MDLDQTVRTSRARTIPDWAWERVTSAVFRDGVLYPELAYWDPEIADMAYEEPDGEQVAAMACFTRDNYDEWAGAAVVCPRGPSLEEVLVRFDNVDRFIAHGYRNPTRPPGVPDWYFFWVGNHPRGVLKRWARAEGLIPAKDLPLGRGGYGIDTGLTSIPMPAEQQRAVTSRGTGPVLHGDGQ